MYLSGNTCNETCLTDYGFMATGTVCVRCDNLCIICFELATNCTSCKTSGQYEAFLMTSTFTCMANCPDNYFNNETTHVCDPCNTECTTCRGNASYCLSCDVGLGYGWNDYSCYNPCPDGTFTNLGGANCSNCAAKCITCENSTT
jgi:proprotein convertase subtilisin/kexin type 5